MDKPTLRIMFTDFWRPATPEYIRRNALYKFLSKYFQLELCDQPDYLMYSSFGVEYLKYDCIRIFFAGENVRPNFSECDYAFSFDYPVTERNYRLPLYRLYPAYPSVFEERSPETIIREERKFCCFLVSNPSARERIQFFKLLSTYKNVDSGGKVLNNIGDQVPIGEVIPWMKHYKFSIAFENASYPGYTTEKLLHSLVSNTIPIYWGNPRVGEDFNTKAFINCHDYDNFEDVVEVVKQIDRDDSRCAEMVSQPILPGGVENHFCREENIIRRFDEIFAEKKVHIPLNIKRKQKLRYPYFYLICLIKKGFSR